MARSGFHFPAVSATFGLTLLLAFTGSLAQAQEPGAIQAEDGRIVVVMDTLTRSEELVVTVQGTEIKVGTTFKDREFVSVLFTLARIKTGHVGLPSHDPGSSISTHLVDSNGVEWKEEWTRGSFQPVPQPAGLRGELEGGVKLHAAFLVPKAVQPKTMKWTYAYWDSRESSEAKFAGIEIPLTIARASTAAEAQQVSEELPGSAGPRVEILSKNPVGVELLDVTVRAVQPTRTEAPVQVLPTGTTDVCIEILIRRRAPAGTTFAIAIENRDGLVDREGVDMNIWKDNRASGESTLSMCPASGEPYPDGPYRGTVTIGEVKVAVLNWSIGTP